MPCTIDQATKLLEEAKRVFPEAELTSITLQMEDGKMAFVKFSKDEVGEDRGSFEPLPEGKYLAQIMNHEWKQTAKGGHMLALTFEITAPSHEGRRVWDNLNIDCDSEEAQKIALRSYKNICVACGAEAMYDAIFEVDESTISDYLEALPQHLYGTDIQLTIGIEKGTNGYADRNRVKSYAEATPTPKAKPAAAPAGKAKPSWAK